MNFDKMLKMALLFGVILVAVLGVFFFGRPQFLVGMVLLAALLELAFNRYQGNEARNHRSGDVR